MTQTTSSITASMAQPLTPRPPRPRAPGWVTVLDLGRDPLRRPLAYFERFGDTFFGQMWGSRYVLSRDPALFEDVLVKQHRAFKKDEITRGLSRLLGNGLLTSEGEQWRNNRKLIQPHLQAGQIERYLDVFEEETDRLASKWQLGQPFDLHSEMAALTMSITLRCVFGTTSYDARAFDKAMRHVMDYFVGVAGTSYPLPLWVPTVANRRFIKARRELGEAALEIVQQSSQSAPSVVQSLRQAQQVGELSQQQLVDEALTMLLAGHETTALALTYTLALLADAPHEQSLIRDELMQLPMPRDVAQLRSCDALVRAIKESMRLYPESWAIGREALQDVQVGGWQVDRETQVFLYQWAAHQNPRYFPEPEKFLPGRWTQQFEQDLPRFAYTPFGGGPRICVGNHFAWAEMLAVMRGLLSRFAFEPLRPFQPRLLASVTVRPKDPVPMIVRAI